MEQEKLRNIAVKMYTFKVIEGIQKFEATIPWGEIESQGYNSKVKKPAVATITLTDERVRIVVHAASTTATASGARTIHSGPIQWLKGVIDYDKPVEEL